MKHLIICILFLFSGIVHAEQTVPVLMYHHITDTFAPGETVTSRARFQEHLDTLAKAGYTTLTISQVVSFVQGKLKIPEKSVAITFDDGWKDQLTAARELEKRGMTATFYVMSGKFADNRYMEKDDLLFLDSKFEVGAHSHTHMTEFEVDHKIDDRVITAEMTISGVLLERVLNRPLKSYAWPYGVTTDASTAAARAAGFTSMVLVSDTSLNKVGTSPERIDRVNVDGRCTAQQVLETVQTGKRISC